MPFAHGTFTEHYQLLHYFYHSDDYTTPDEMVDFLLKIKQKLSHKGLYIPQLSLTFSMLREHLLDYEIEILEENWNPFLEFLDEKEDLFSRIASSDLDRQLAFTGSQFVGASLCYFIPHPEAPLVGRILIEGGLISRIEEEIPTKRVKNI